MASSTHPVQAGGYARKDYASLDAFIDDVRANVNPLADKILKIYPELDRWRKELTERTYDPAKQPKAPSFFELLAKAPKSLTSLLPGLKPEFQATLYPAGTPPEKWGYETLLDATGLVERVKSGEVTASQVVEASLARVALAQEALGCFTEITADEARARAKELDAKQARGEPLGAMHGLPISIKGNIDHPGTLSTRCYVVDMLKTEDVIDPKAPGADSIDPAIIGSPTATENALIVEAMLQAGAIIVGKTTMPTTIMQLDTRSAVFGQTVNAYNVSLSPGGSSGGEGACVASGASAMGVGSDIGGSIRQPASKSNLWGFRSTAHRIPLAGGRDPGPGNVGVDAVAGPLTRSLRDVQLFMHVVLHPQAISGKSVWDIDFSNQPRPWKEVSWLNQTIRASRSYQGKKPKLVIGVVRDDGVVSPQPPIRRAIKHVADQLKAFAASGQGKDWLEIKELPEPLGDHKKGWELIRKLYWHDGAVKTRALLAAGHESLDPLTEFILSAPYVPTEPLTATQVFNLRHERESYKAKYWADWDKAGIDVLLAPATTSVAERPEQAYYWGYTSAWNLMNYSSLSFPSGVYADTKLDQAYVESEQAANATRGPFGPEDEKEATEYEKLKSIFDGAPVGLQLIAKRDEELVEAAEVVAHTLHQN